jgi:hypothetical protein
MIAGSRPTPCCLGLPFGTYRYHLARGTDRVVSWLWQRELHGVGAGSSVRPGDSSQRGRADGTTAGQPSHTCSSRSPVTSLPFGHFAVSGRSGFTILRIMAW